MKLQKKLIPDIPQLPVLPARLRPEWKIIGPVADIRSASAAIRSYPDLDLIFADKWEYIYKLFRYSLGVTPFIRKKKRPKVVESA